jgi:hypothetical protein
MSLYKDPLSVILAAITEQNPGVVLVAAEYVFGQPVAVAEDAKLTNTTLLITAKDITTPYDGFVTIRYRRLPLSDLVQLVPLTLRANALATTLDVALLLNQVYGINFTADDIESTPLALVNGAGTVTLTAKANSLGWIGTVDATIEAGRFDLNDYVTVTALAGLPYPDNDLTKPFAWGYSYWRDCSSIYQTLQAAFTGDTNTQTDLAAALATLTGDTWTATAAGRYSLLGASIDYAGITTGRTDVNTDYSHVVIVQLLAANSLGLSGKLTLHYHLPEDEV